MAFLTGGANSAVDTGGYDVANSCRFNDGSSDHLLIAPSSAGDKQTWTWSAWVKRGVLGTRQVLFSGYDQAAGLGESIEFTSGDLLEYDLDIAGTDFTVTSSMVFRDVTAWYHILFIKDVTESTETNRIKVYVNGVQIALVENANGYPAENATNGLINAAGNYEHHVGCLVPNSSFFDGYMCEVVFIDGTAQTNTDFGEFDEDSPTIWKPKDVSGLTFGTNGFYLDFEDSSNLGNDANGGSDFTVNNLTATDQSTDTCTNNFATLNPLIYESRDNTFAEGNLKITGGGGNDWVNHYGVSNFAVSSGKWFVEAKATTMVTSQGVLGIMGTSTALAGSMRDTGPANIDSGGRISGGGGDHQTGLTSFSNGDIAGAAFDADNGTIQFYRNGSTYGNAVSSIASDTYYFVTNSYEAGAVVEFNFGSPPYAISSGNADADGYGNFEYAVPSGYFALCTKNLGAYGG